MKQFYMLFLFYNIFIFSKAYNLRNTNSMENRIESNYNNLLIPQEQTENQNSEKEQSQIKTLKGIIQNLVKLHK